MGSLIGLLVLLVIFGTPILILANVAKQKAKQKKAYGDALQRLKQDPNNPDLREKALQLGRLYFPSEPMLMNDINAACAGRVEVTNPHALSGKSVAQQIEELKQLFLAGVITAEEFERGKTLFLGAPPDKASAAVKLLSHLDDLRKQGVLSESEFRMKKWDILSERLLPGKGEASKL